MYASGKNRKLSARLHRHCRDRAMIAAHMLRTAGASATAICRAVDFARTANHYALRALKKASS